MAGRFGRDLGGILGLILLFEEYRAAFDYDWRTRFRLPAESIGGEMPWDEAVRLVRILRADPSSQIAAAIEGWDYPLSREGWQMADLIDVQGASKAGKKWKAYTRPIKAADGSEKKRRGNAAGRTRAEVIEILRGFGHEPPV